jgi:hypothetical protein
VHVPEYKANEAANGVTVELSSTTLRLKIPFAGTTAVYQTSLLLKDPHPGSTIPVVSVEFTEVPKVVLQLVFTGIEIAPHGLSLTGGVIQVIAPEKPEDTPPPLESSLKLMHPPTVL